MIYELQNWLAESRAIRKLWKRLPSFCIADHSGSDAIFRKHKRVSQD